MKLSFLIGSIIMKSIITLFAALSIASVSVSAAEFSVSSPVIKPNSKLSTSQVFNGFGCTGDNISPELTWTNAPTGTQSFALTMYDPDAPTGSGWWHWVVYNIPANVTHLSANAGSVDAQQLPQGAVQGRTDFGTSGYGGACPPVGDKPHRYQITVHALKVDHLDLPADASAALIGFMIRANRIGSTTLQAKYSR
jgi:hypothetical protein